MFLSLKGAIGRNPMLNRVGQKLLQSFGGASAAYSLRNLASNIASVVRVRRASDNSEKDFSAADISSGAMTGWVNSQIVPPLDIRELDSNGERTGALVEAAAAYSLRNLSSSYTGNVVIVRRSSDNAEELFTAAEVADGTLTDWVNAVETVGAESDFSSTISPYNLYQADGSTISLNETIGGETGALKITSQGGSCHLRYLGAITNLSVNTTIKISIKVYIPSSNTSLDGLTFSLPNFTVTSGQLANTIPTDTWTTVTVEGTSSDLSTPNSWRIYPRNRSANDVIYLKNYRITQDIADGFVSQWYDQSGNGNPAMQTTAANQPKIVDGGSLVTRNSKPSILFGGAADNYLDVVGRPLTKSVFSTLQASNTNFETLICDTTDNFPRLTTNNAANNRAYKLEGFGTPSVNIDGVTYNGTSSVYSFYFHLLGMTSGTGSAIDRIGANPAVSATGNSFNFVSELILYPDDQSDNRTAIEANIGETYNIDLPSGVDTGYDQVDGFVETWYDQSGNGNDAVQEVAGSQPKIVDAGSLLNKLKFEGAQFLQRAFTSPLSQPNSSFVVAQMDAGTGNTKIFDGIDNLSRNLLFASNDTDFAMFAGSTQKYADRDANENLHTAIFNQDSSLGALNGVVTSISGIGSQDAGGITIGRTGVVETGFLTGTVSELIFYPSDQSANREAIEANINNQYDIY